MLVRIAPALLNGRTINDIMALITSTSTLVDVVRDSVYVQVCVCV